MTFICCQAPLYLFLLLLVQWSDQRFFNMQDNSDLLFDCQRSETPGLVELCNAFSAHKFRLPSQGHAVDVNKAWAELRGEVHSAYNIGGSGEEKGKAQTGKEHGLITRWYNRVSGTVDEWINFLPTWDDMNETYAGFCATSGRFLRSRECAALLVKMLKAPKDALKLLSETDTFDRMKSKAMCLMLQMFLQDGDRSDTRGNITHTFSNSPTTSPKGLGYTARTRVIFKDLTGAFRIIDLTKTEVLDSEFRRIRGVFVKGAKLDPGKIEENKKKNASLAVSAVQQVLNWSLDWYYSENSENKDSKETAAVIGAEPGSAEDKEKIINTLTAEQLLKLEARIPVDSRKFLITSINTPLTSRIQDIVSGSGDEDEDAIDLGGRFFLADDRMKMVIEKVRATYKLSVGYSLGVTGGSKLAYEKFKDKMEELKKENPADFAGNFSVALLDSATDPTTWGTVAAAGVAAVNPLAAAVNEGVKIFTEDTKDASAPIGCGCESWSDASASDDDYI